MRAGEIASQSNFVSIAVALFFAISASAQPHIVLETGDIIVLDGNNHAVYHVDPVTNVETEIVSGSVVNSPRGVAVSPEGLLYVTDTFNDWLVRIDPFTGSAIPIFSFVTSGPPPFPDPAAALADEESNWDILVVEADRQQIVRIDPVLPGNSVVEFDLVGAIFPIGLARDPLDQSLVVADRFQIDPLEPTGIYRVDSGANTQTVVSLRSEYQSLRRIAVQADGGIIVSDRGLGGLGEAVWRIPPGSSTPEIFGSTGDDFTGPQGIAVDPADNTVLVADFITGELWRVQPDGNSKSLINNNFSGPFDVIVVPTLAPRDHDQFLISEASPGGATGQVYLADSAADSRAPVAATGGAAFSEPRAMAFEHPDDTLASGAIYVIDGPTTIVRRDLASGAQTVVSDVSTGNEFDDLSDIAIEFGNPLGMIVVTDAGDGQVIRVDPVGGAQTVLGSIPGTPTSIVVDGNGSLIVTAKDLDDDGDPLDDSGLFRVNPITGEVTHFTVFLGVNPVKFADPVGLALDPSGDVLLVDRGGIVDQTPIIAAIYLIEGTDTPFKSVVAFGLSTAADPSLPDTVAMVVDGNRDMVVAFDADEPKRIDLIPNSAVTQMIGGNLDLATDLLFEGMPPPGDPVDTDGDSIPDGFDNCPVDWNPGQEDVDFNGDGDVCQLQDIDLDGWSDFGDNCPFLPNSDQADADLDENGDVCDNCVDIANNQQLDFNQNGIGDACEDSDVDGVLDSIDVCPGIANPGQDDVDNDGVGDVCDNCPDNFDPDQSDLNEDGFGDVCQPGDSDGDGIPDNGGPEPCNSFEGVNCDDNCPNDANPLQSDLNDDGVGDTCEPDDDDFDGWPNSEDNCPDDFNPSQSDLNEDGVGDACQDALAGPDFDFDGIPDDGGPAPCANGVTVDCDDNCPENFNPSQSDLNEDGSGDACQPGDVDNDGIPDDGGPVVCANGVTLACDDNCQTTFNPTQGDLNGDLIGDACQPGDADGDGWPDTEDNCPYYPNQNQDDLDSDSVGDACDNNTDADGLVDILDNCPMQPNSVLLGTCLDGTIGLLCTRDGACNTTHDGTCTAMMQCTAGTIGTACTVNVECDSVNGAGDGVCEEVFECTAGGSIGSSCVFDDDCDTTADGFCSQGQEDGEMDGSGDACDNCLTIPNAILQGTCSAGLVGALCQEDAECDFEAIVGVCSLDQEDADSDGSGDVCDNCITTANGPDAYAPSTAAVSQCDSDSDGFGNVCDADLNGDGFATVLDNFEFITALAAFFPPPPGDADLTCDGFVTPIDTSYYRTLLQAFFPGPSGWDCAGTAPCPPPPAP